MPVQAEVVELVTPSASSLTLGQGQAGNTHPDADLLRTVERAGHRRVLLSGHQLISHQNSGRVRYTFRLVRQLDHGGTDEYRRRWSWVRIVPGITIPLACGTQDPPDKGGQRWAAGPIVEVRDASLRRMMVATDHWMTRRDPTVAGTCAKKIKRSLSLELR